MFSVYKITQWPHFSAFDSRLGGIQPHLRLNTVIPAQIWAARTVTVKIDRRRRHSVPCKLLMNKSWGMLVQILYSSQS